MQANFIQLTVDLLKIVFGGGMENKIIKVLIGVKLQFLVVFPLSGIFIYIYEVKSISESG